MPNKEILTSGENNVNPDFGNNKDSSTLPFANQPLHIIWVYLKGDPHHAAYQIPLEAVATWKKLESVLRHILDAKGQLVLSGCDDEAIVLQALWPYYLRSGAKFNFSYRPLIEVLILDSAGDNILTLRLDESEGIFFLRRQAHAYLQSLTPPCKFPVSVQDLQLRNRVSDDSLSENLVQDDVLLADLVQGGQSTLTLVASNVEAYSNEEESSKVKKRHSTEDGIPKFEQHLEEEVSRMKKSLAQDTNFVEVSKVKKPLTAEEVLAQDTNLEEKVSDMETMYPAQEFLSQEDFADEGEARRKAESARKTPNWNAAPVHFESHLSSSPTAVLNLFNSSNSKHRWEVDPVSKSLREAEKPVLASSYEVDELVSEFYFEADEPGQELSSESFGLPPVEIPTPYIQEPCDTPLKPPSPTNSDPTSAAPIKTPPTSSTTFFPITITPSTSSSPAMDPKDKELEQLSQSFKADPTEKEMESTEYAAELRGLRKAIRRFEDAMAIFEPPGKWVDGEVARCEGKEGRSEKEKAVNFEGLREGFSNGGVEWDWSS